MNRLVQELKTRARLRLNASRREAAEPVAAEQRLRDCLHEVSRAVGFAHWEHARRVLSGEARAGDDQGRFWYAAGCQSLLTPWFARYDEAVLAWSSASEGVLLPYRRQFVLASDDFLVELGLDPDSSLWSEVGRDLVRSAGSPAWEALAWQRLRATRSETAAPPRDRGPAVGRRRAPS